MMVGAIPKRMRKNSPETLDLTSELADEDDDVGAPEDGPVQDDLLASADRLAAEDRPVEARLGGSRRRALLGGGKRWARGAGGAGGGGSPGGGSTLFERMANLSRSTARSDDEDEEDGEGDDGPAAQHPALS